MVKSGILKNGLKILKLSRWMDFKAERKSEFKFFYFLFFFFKNKKNYILISCVRSNDEQIIGFLSNPRRLNVAITRAKFGLIICGNAKILARVKIQII